MLSYVGLQRCTDHKQASCTRMNLILMPLSYAHSCLKVSKRWIKEQIPPSPKERGRGPSGLLGYTLNAGRKLVFFRKWKVPCKAPHNSGNPVCASPDNYGKVAWAPGKTLAHHMPVCGIFPKKRECQLVSSSLGMWLYWLHWISAVVALEYGKPSGIEAVSVFAITPCWFCPHTRRPCKTPSDL